MDEINREAREVLVVAIAMRVNQQTPPEGLRDLAEACRAIGVFAGHDVADKILVEVQYRVTRGTSQGLRTLAETWGILQPPGRVLDLVSNEHSSHPPVAPIS